MPENIQKYLPGTDDQQHIDSGDDLNQLTGEMSLFALTDPPRGNFLSKSNSLDLMDGSAFNVPPKSLQNGGQQHIFDLNMNSFNDLIFPNENVQYRSTWDQLVKEASLNPSDFSDVTRSSSVDVGIKQTEKTETRQTTVEVKVTSHADDAIKRKTASSEAESKTVDISDSVTDIVDNVTNEKIDVTRIVGEEKETEPKIAAAEAEPETDADAKESRVLHLIETMVELQQKYNHLKSNWDHIGNALSQCFNYLPIPGVFTRMLGFSSNDEQKGFDRRINGASSQTYMYLPHGACKRCAERREKQRGKQSPKEKDGRHLGNDITNTANSKTDSGITAEKHTMNENEHYVLNLENSQDNVNKASDDKPRISLSVSCSGHVDILTNSSNMADSNRGTKQRHLSKMSRDCAGINRLLINVVKENMQGKK